MASVCLGTLCSRNHVHPQRSAPEQFVMTPLRSAPPTAVYDNNEYASRQKAPLDIRLERRSDAGTDIEALRPYIYSY